MLAISSSASEGLIRLSRQSITIGKCFNPYCDLPGSNCATLIVSKLFRAGTCHWFLSKYPIWFFYSPWLKNSTIFLIGVTAVIISDAAVFWRSILHNLQLLLNLLLSHTLRSSSEILTFSSSFPSQSSYRKQMLKTPFANAKADILDLNSIRFHTEIWEMQFRINTHSFVHKFRCAFFFLNVQRFSWIMPIKWTFTTLGHFLKYEWSEKKIMSILPLYDLEWESKVDFCLKYSRYPVSSKPQFQEFKDTTKAVVREKPAIAAYRHLSGNLMLPADIYLPPISDACRDKCNRSYKGNRCCILISF